MSAADRVRPPPPLGPCAAPMRLEAGWTPPLSLALFSVPSDAALAAPRSKSPGAPRERTPTKRMTKRRRAVSDCCVRLYAPEGRALCCPDTTVKPSSAIRKSTPLPFCDSRPCASSRETRRATLRGVVASVSIDAEDDLCASLWSATLQSQRVALAPGTSSIDVTLSPECLPIMPGGRVHFHLMLPRSSRHDAGCAATTSLVTACIGEVARCHDRPTVVSTRSCPSGGLCEVVMENSGDVPILEAFGVRFSVLSDPSDDAQSSGWASDVQHIGGMTRRNGTRNKSERPTTELATCGDTVPSDGGFPNAEQFSAVCRDLRKLSDEIFYHSASHHVAEQKRAITV